MPKSDAARIDPELAREVLGVAGALCERHEISALQEFLDSVRCFARDDILNIAVFGRFKAGKSSFLNHLLDRQLLPVGAVPVTSAVTMIQWGPRERAEISFLDGRSIEVPIERIGDFISEGANPENHKKVERVLVELPSMHRFRGLRFVDTPGLESVLRHNTDASLEWLPKVGLAIVAVGVDPPLSRHDIELIRNLSRYTPKISLLLTKIDLLDEGEFREVRGFVRKQLLRYWNEAIPIFPYSVRPGYERLTAELERELLSPLRTDNDEQHAAILLHKLDSLLSECAGYLNVALKSAEVADSQRELLKFKILGQKESLADTRLAVALIARHAAANTRSAFEALLRVDELSCRTGLQRELDEKFPSWYRGLGKTTARFEEWVSDVLTREMADISNRHRGELLEPLHRVAHQLSQSLEDFRNRLSDRMLETLGIHLETTEMDFQPEVPGSPDIRIGKIFDRNWELLSWLIPMAVVRGTIRKHFRNRVADLVSINISRLASQWEEAINSALLTLEKESVRRLDALIGTIEKLVMSDPGEATRIRSDLQRIEDLRRRLS